MMTRGTKVEATDDDESHGNHGGKDPKRHPVFDYWDNKIYGTRA